MKQHREINNTKYGNFFIEEYAKDKFCIWWDFYDEHDGLCMEPGVDFLDWFKDCDIKDFSDLPKEGFFKSIEEATNYINNKFKL